MSLNLTQTIHARIVSPKAVLFEDEVLAVSSENTEGKFDIIAQHANFITLLENRKITVLMKDRTKKEFPVKEAILYAASNKVTVYTELG